MKVDSCVIQLLSFKELTAKWEKQTSQQNLCTMWLLPENLWGRNSKGREEEKVFQAQEVTFAKAKPEETFSFNNREVDGYVWI